MECPCNNCICIPVCKHKKYTKLFKDCILLRTYIPEFQWVGGRSPHITIVEKILKLTKWFLELKKDSGVYVFSKRR